ncbi:MAG TPA: hypothetical protein VGJ60_30670 [Chloroflexota bacterium]|jgi:hypothetical protein
MSAPGNGHNGAATPPVSEVRLIEIDLSDLRLSADLSQPDQVAMATAHIYERFVPYADEGWEWVTFPGSREFDGWVVSERAHDRTILSVRLLSRRAEPSESGAVSRPAHGVSAYRTRQLTGRAWTAEPGSKLWRSLV